MPREDYELRCTEPECSEYVRNAPHGDYASCPKGHGKLHQRLGREEEDYVAVKTIQHAIREPSGDLFFYRVPGVPGLWKLGKPFESELCSDIAAAVKRGRVLAIVGEQIFRMKPSVRAPRKPKPAPVPVLPSQQELPLVLDPVASQEAAECQQTQS
jgi:hypothetical protein